MGKDSTGIHQPGELHHVILPRVYAGHRSNIVEVLATREHKLLDNINSKNKRRERKR
jgi:hypothetical protein